MQREKAFTLIFFSDFDHNTDGQKHEGKKIKVIMKTLQAFCAAKSSAEV